jgi:5-methylcytosine-specific restriction endonuclease McrA
MLPAGSMSSAAATRDHVVPKCHGGTQIMIICFTCNNLKGDMDLDAWNWYMRSNPYWWKTHPRKPGRFRGI